MNCIASWPGGAVCDAALAGPLAQDDAAEDPLAAAEAGQSADYSLYWQACRAAVCLFSH